MRPAPQQPIHLDLFQHAQCYKARQVDLLRDVRYKGAHHIIVDERPVAQAVADGHDYGLQQGLQE